MSFIPLFYYVFIARWWALAVMAPCELCRRATFSSEANAYTSVAPLRRRFFYSAACMQGGLSHERNVCLSVCLSNAWIVIKRKKNFCQNFYTIYKVHSSSFLTGRMVSGVDPFYLKVLGKTDPVTSETSIFNLYQLVASRVSSNTRRKKSSIMMHYGLSSEPKMNNVRCL